MASRIQHVTLLPALCFFILSMIFAFISLIVIDFSLKQSLLVLTASLFIGGLVLTIHWSYSWIWSKKFHENQSGFLNWILSHSRLFGITFLVFGVIFLSWVGWLTWYDMIEWGKDLGTIFFGTRLGETMSLGLGVQLIHYFLLGLTFILIGLVVLFNSLRSCPHYFGYLGSRFRNTPIHTKCLYCIMKADCMITDKR